jgi:molybdenum cofactor biosynthesis enzyme MoaA
MPESVKRLADSGLNSLRVSINSAQEKFHTNYYRPRGFSLQDVCKSIQVMKDADAFVSLNYFILPGVTDSEPELNALRKLLSTFNPDRIQLRNLNMDPEWYLSSIEFNASTKAIGMKKWLSKIKHEFPGLQFGYYNPSIR